MGRKWEAVRGQPEGYPRLRAARPILSPAQPGAPTARMACVTLRGLFEPRPWLASSRVHVALELRTQSDRAVLRVGDTNAVKCFSKRSRSHNGRKMMKLPFPDSGLLLHNYIRVPILLVTISSW